MRYRATFDLGDRPGARLPLRTGLYAIIRTENRVITLSDQDNPDWSNICLDRDTARLHVKSNDDDGGDCGGRLFTDHSYLVFSVETGDLPESALALRRFSALTEELRTMTTPTVGAVQRVLDNAASTHARETWENEVWTALAELNNRAAAYGGLPPAPCAVPDAEASRVRARFIEQVVAAHAAMSRAAQGATAGSTPAYELEVYQRQAAELARFFGELDWAAGDGESDPTPEGRWARAGDPARFVETFGDVSAFRARVEARATEAWGVTCPAR